ncbi:gas vesicle protein [Haloquadratum walsbyi]|uniref:gas vesicle protein GvpO n=1 Tax=Haloquadratum walsbyi TaxID=293091 RepID=UPI0030B8646B
MMIRTDGGRDSEESEMMSEERGNKNQAETVSETETVESIGIIEAQECAKTAAKELFEHDFKSVIKVEADDNNEWRTVIELVERRAVPDTQDIIGRYEINLTSTGNVAGYELVERYQRGDMKEEL